MANTMLDLRRTDQRTNVRINPVWVTSAEITFAANGTEAVLFSFPLAGGNFLIHNMFFDVTTAFTGGSPVITIGSGHIPLESSTTGDTVTITDADEYMDATDITEGVAARYYPLVGGSDWSQTCALSVGDGGCDLSFIEGADSSVIVIYADVSGGPTAGAARLHVLMSKIQ